MLGNLLSSAIRIASLPVDAVNSAKDMALGGDGSKQSRNSDNGVPDPFQMAEKLRDNVADTVKDIDS